MLSDRVQRGRCNTAALGAVGRTAKLTRCDTGPKIRSDGSCGSCKDALGGIRWWASICPIIPLAIASLLKTLRSSSKSRMT